MYRQTTSRMKALSSAVATSDLPLRRVACFGPHRSPIEFEVQRARQTVQSSTLIPVHPLGCSPKFPALSQKFPVRLSREFHCKPLNLLACQRAKLRPEGNRMLSRRLNSRRQWETSQHTTQTALRIGTIRPTEYFSLTDGQNRSVRKRIGARDAKSQRPRNIAA
jgi:hypothetical protein